MSNDSESVAKKLMPQAKDLREYQELKESHEKEVEATAKLRENLEKKHGSKTAEEMRKRGFDPNLRR